MTKKIVIAGCRHYTNYEEAKAFIDSCIEKIQKEFKIIIVSGGASGADSLGERYAAEHNLEVELFLADWEKFGKRAGPMRNKQMAEICDYVICFWDEKSKGTKSMIECARKLGKEVIIKKI